MLKIDKLQITGFKSFADPTEIVLGEGITAIVGPNGCGKCVSGDTLVTLANGSEVPIRDLVDAALECSVDVEQFDDGVVTRRNPHGVEILSLDPKTLRLEPRPVAAFVRREATPRLLRIRTRAGREVTATPYHPLFTLADGVLRSLKAEELSVGVRIAVPRRLPVSAREVGISALDALERFRDEDRMYVANSAPLKAWAATARAEFGTYSRWMESAHVPSSRVRGMLGDQAVNATGLAHLARAVDSGSRDKEVPPQVFEATDDVRWAFLSGLFEGDAYLSVPSVERPRKAPYIEYVTASRKLADQVVSLLLQLGVFAVSRPKERYASNTVAKTKRTYHSVLIYGSEQVRRAAEQLSFVGRKQVRLEALRQLAPASNPNLDVVPGATPIVKEAVRAAGVNLKANRRGHAKLAAYVEGRCEASRGGLLQVADQIRQLAATPERAADALDRITLLAESDVYWDEIVSIDEVVSPDEWVYDLSVDETHNFVAGNIVVHNSNVSDAISWVLGEQSAKNLRGSKMEDVIFNGTRDRKPVGMAEVILTLVAIEDVTPQTEVDDIEIPEEHEVVLPEEAAPEPAPEQDSSEPAVVVPKPRTVRHHRAPKTNTLLLAAGERVTVGRRLYRSGESDYFMNGRTCRLRDIHELFAGTGLGGYHYAIVEQGRIGQILSSKPQDRRALIEEAAGITKFKLRKRAAELRLESARTNLYRLNDIVSEIERQIASLKRQAAKAKRYRRLRDEMRGLLRDVFAADWERLEAELDRLDRLSKRARAEHESLLAGLAEGDAEHRAVAHRAREAEEELARVRERAAALDLEADRARNRHLFLQEQLAGTMLRREEIERERDAVSERLGLIAAERVRRTEDHAALASETDAEAARLAEQEASYQSKLRALDDRERALEGLRQRLVAEVARTERLRNQQHQIDETERRLGLDGARLEREAGQAASKRDEAEAHLTELAGELQMTEAKLEELRRVIVERVEALDAARGRAADAARRLAELQEQRSARGHRLASLEDLDTRHAYYSDAVQQVLSLEQTSFNALGTLADYAEVEPEFEPALESLFGRELQSVLVPGIDEALSGVEYLVTTGAGRAAFLVVGTGGGEEGDQDRSKANGSASLLDPGPRPALALLRLPAEIERAVARAYPEKAAALVVATLDEALERSRAAEGEPRIFVTLAGEQVVNGRVVVGGTTVTQGAHLLGLKREIKELKAELERIVWEVGSAEAEVAEARRAVSELEAESGQLDSTLREDEKTAIERSMRQRQLEADFERAEQHIRVVESERRRLAEEIAELATRREGIDAELAEAVADRERVEGQLAEAQASLAELRGTVESEGQTLAEARAAAAARQERRRAVAAELRRLADEEADLTSRRDRSQVEAAEAEARITQLTSTIAETEGQSEQYSAERAGMDDALATAMGALTSARERVDALEEELVEIRERLEAARSKGSEYEVERARLLSDAEHVRRGAVSELSQSIEEVVEAAKEARAAGPVDDEPELDEEEESDAFADDIPLPADPAEVPRARLDQIRRTIDGLGAVNMMALEELEESQQRFEFLTTQRQDVLDSIESTEDALTEIKRRSRQRFRDAFAEINRNFGDMFQELFGGGRGEMVLLDEEDLLETGIDIIAQPPGKRLQNVLLLSGGEKAMTAIALVLAIFKYKPSPFCILDEVDAPLDEVNVGRFSDHIIEMSRTTQFLVITHSKRTMEAARALYGVTMEEPGVSKLVSVRFADHLPDQEPEPASSII